PLKWDSATNTVIPRKDLLKDSKPFLKSGEAAPANEEKAIELVMDRAVKFEPVNPGEFILSDKNKK
ncbi:MAG: hypothetical protein ABH885_04225, partial [Candidatus Omnitrophota bacterium]